MGIFNPWEVGAPANGVVTPGIGWPGPSVHLSEVGNPTTGWLLRPRLDRKPSRPGMRILDLDQKRHPVGCHRAGRHGELEGWQSQRLRQLGQMDKVHSLGKTVNNCQNCGGSPVTKSCQSETRVSLGWVEGATSQPQVGGRSC